MRIVNSYISISKKRKYYAYIWRGIKEGCIFKRWIKRINKNKKVPQFFKQKELEKQFFCTKNLRFILVMSA